MLELVGGAPGGTPCESRASGCKTLAIHPAHAVHRLIWARSDCKRLVYDPSLHSSAARDSFCANVHSAAAAQKATAGVEHPALRVAALITAIGNKNTEPPGALAIPPKRHYLLLSSQYRATTPLQHDARSQHNTQARARAAIHF